MFARRLLQEHNILRHYNILKRYLKEASAACPMETHFEPLAKKKPERLSYLKALISGEADKEALTYPEEISPRYDDFFKWMKSVECYMSNCTASNKVLNKKEVLDQLRELEVFRTHIDEQYFGLNLSNTESLKLVETLSNLPWLGAYIIKNHILPVQIISKYGSDQQKMKYFAKILSGEVIPSICIYEEGGRTNINNISTYLMRNDTNSWLLNGNKTYVVNGTSSNLFLVFAKNEQPFTKITGPESFSLLLVEKDFGGVTCTNVYDTIGRHETPTCTINFQDTIVPRENLISTGAPAFKILLEYLKPGQQNIPGLAIAILRNFINQLIPDILDMKHFDRNYYEFDVVKKTIGEISFSLYTMESMAYLTTGLMDKYENQDAGLERAITEKYCANKCLESIQAGIQLVGSRSYVNNKSYMQAFHDAIALSTMDANNFDADTYIAAKMLQFIGKKLNDRIYKKRKFLEFPVFNMMDSLFDNSRISISDVEEHLHPSVLDGVEHLEQSINKFRDSIMTMFKFSGAEILDKYSDMQRVSQMLTEIYGTYANLLRGSRAYAIGVRNADIDKNVSVRMAFTSLMRVTAIAEEVNAGPVQNGDNCYLTTADVLYNAHKYALDHPLKKTF
ncbi:acyl-CoA dehydrogenase family member 9, mitochondrial-like [Ceratina calcarata]|uniref:Acyl-CoA dehydrogenase family member 9, mitochondrial-like n=1 Tax=Ceratina calcarata TaxID=156304 RepID=A0AAJ7J1B7_9HYME|nr:acyl-CoA dehydrogenase family member 9, mitochondrial-like [Ceratina calcarata]